MTAGQLTFRWPDYDETYVAGDAYYAPSGHLPLVTGGTTIVEFSPTADLEATMAVVQQNLTGSGARASGDWDEARQREHAEAVQLIRP